MSGAARVFGRDDRDLSEYPQRPHRDVLEVPDRSCNHEQRTGHVRARFHCTIGGSVFRVAASSTMIASEPLPHFVDDLLGYLHETHPTLATLDGVHAHDDLLEDLSRH